MARKRAGRAGVAGAPKPRKRAPKAPKPRKRPKPAPAPAPRKRPKSESRKRSKSARAPIDAQRIYRRVPAPLVKWHRVDDWAFEAVREASRFEPEMVEDDSPRVSGWTGGLAEDPWDPDMDTSVAEPLYELRIADGPTAEKGGVRRVIIRALLWSYDREEGDLHSPGWFTIGTGFSARAATMEVRRFVKAYERALMDGLESRELWYSAVEIMFWTAADNVPYW